MPTRNDECAADPARAVPARRVALVVFDGVEILDVAGPASVFAKANEQVPGTYALRVLAAGEGMVATSAGLAIAPHGRWTQGDSGPVDTLIVAGGSEDALRRLLLGTGLGAWIAEVARSARRVASVCTGAFALAQAGLLHGRRSTTHWSACGLLQSLCPDTTVVDDQIYVRDGAVWTSAGVLTGVDLALALVEEDLGRGHAMQIARNLVVAGLRPGLAPQSSPLLQAQARAGHPLRELLAWVREHLADDLRVERLAERTAMSPRHFARVFQREIGMAPARYVQAVRLDEAALLLRETAWSIERVAVQCGFASTDALQRGFRQRWGVPPGEYRRSAVQR
ncbi:MAG: helix-turn-helix domain-containing protein [Burkholderiaceae bacterium]|nr:MAG: helix-turn-helix domain-containing protein [Burkholderiaceae bacterium]